MIGSRRLQDKVAIVTGAGAADNGIGNGRATAILFAREGAKVLLVGRTREPLERTLEMIKVDSGGEAAIFQADVAISDDCAALVRAATERWGRLNIVHNNVGITGAGSVVEVAEQDWEHIMHTNVTSMMLMGKYAIPVMVRGGEGVIINISSTSATRPRGLTPYTVSKGAIISLTRAMAIDHAADGIRVNCIIVGPVYTPRMAAGGRMSAERREQRRRASPLGIEGTGWDVGHAAVFLASDESRYITGVALPVDGGVSIASPQR